MAKIIVILLVPDKLIQKRSKYREIFEPQYVIVLSQIISDSTDLYHPIVTIGRITIIFGSEKRHTGSPESIRGVVLYVRVDHSTCTGSLLVLYNYNVLLGRYL